eukprot:scaffold104_cov375-Prasinococcus_capsulatus_cf.AAC.29
MRPGQVSAVSAAGRGEQVDSSAAHAPHLSACPAKGGFCHAAAGATATAAAATAATPTQLGPAHFTQPRRSRAGPRESSRCPRPGAREADTHLPVGGWEGPARAGWAAPAR